jgi:hypothetical protein
MCLWYIGKSESESGVRHIVFLGAALFLVACKPSSERYAQSVTIDLPPAVPVDSINLAEAAPVREPSPAAPLPSTRPAPKPKQAAAEPRVVMASLALEPPQPAPPGAEPAAPAAEPAAVRSRPALSDALIARTLARIGFPCGQVVAANRVDEVSDAPAWRIDCSSGAAYRGTDRNGRLRFKRW